MQVYTVSQPPGKPKLQLVKVALTAFAQPGDVIDFTIRFDNLGNEPLDHVVIVDSLSPRLEYVSAAKQCPVQRRARFSTVPNEVGSLVVRLRWTTRCCPAKAASSASSAACGSGAGWRSRRIARGLFHGERLAPFGPTTSSGAFKSWRQGSWSGKIKRGCRANEWLAIVRR